MKIKLTVILSFILLFSSISYSLLKLSLWDYDFWWHAATGRYIVENGSLPETDPFSFTSALEENKSLRPERESFILKQYWLAQVIFYLTYSALGAKGMIILRSMLIIIFLGAVSWGLYLKGVRFYINFVLTFLIYTASLAFISERPVLFTMIITVLVFLLLDDFAQNRSRRIFFLPMLMILWSNLHGGFIIGDTMIAVFMVGEMLNVIFKRTGYTKKELTIFYSAAVLSILGSMLNPNGIYAFFIAFSSQYSHFTAEIQEYQPPIRMYLNEMTHINWGYAVTVIMYPLIFIRIKKISISHLILLSGLFYEGLTALRFTIYYSSIAVIILGSELNIIVGQALGKTSVKMNRRLATVFTIAVFISAASYFAGVVSFESLRFKHATLYSVPKDGVDFIEKNRLEGNIFHDYAIGGYLAWRLYPWKKNFIDTRGLNYTVMTEYGAIGRGRNSFSYPPALSSFDFDKEIKVDTPLWQRLLDHYNINLIFLFPLDHIGEIPMLIFKLAESDEWVPIYTDYLSIIYIKNTPENRDIIKKFRRTNEDVYKTVIIQASIRAKDHMKNYRYLVSMGETFYKMGRLNDAVSAYEYASKIMPGAESIMEKIDLIKSEL